MKPTGDIRPVILIVDGDVLHRNLLRTALQKDYEILVASSACEALELFRKRKKVVNVVLSDWEMPGMDGLSLCRQLRLKRPQLKALFMTAGALNALEYGGQPLPLLRKPVDLHMLRAELKHLITVEAVPENPKTILVVDDDLKRRARTSRILKRNGYAVLTARRKKQAASLIDNASEIDLIIAAVKMDDATGGVSLAEYVDASRPRVSTLLISHSDPAILRQISGFSAQPEFLANPFTPEALLERVCHLIRD